MSTQTAPKVIMREEKTLFGEIEELYLKYDKVANHLCLYGDRNEFLDYQLALLVLAEVKTVAEKLKFSPKSSKKERKEIFKDFIYESQDMQLEG